MENKLQQLKTARFAELCGVSRQTLIYYDRIGLFKPHYVDEKGYRYYSIKQYETFLTINMLIDLGTPLAEIKEYLANRSVDSFMTLLDQKEREVAVKIHKLKRISAMIQYRKKSLSLSKTVKDPGEITVSLEPEEYFIVSEKMVNNEDSEFFRIISEMENTISHLKVATYSNGAIVKKESLVGEFDYYISRLCAKTTKPVKGGLVKKEGVYASIFHKGDYQSLEVSYGKLLSYLSETDYIVAGDAYEEDVLDSFTQPREENYLTRISIPVKKILL